MQEIVDTYAHLTVGSPYLLPIITKQDGTERRQYERMEHKVNRLLKKIGALVGLQIPLTTYVGRHCWASTMRDMGVSLSIVSKGLGHESLRTTQIYLSSIDTEGVVKANRQLIGKIFANKTAGICSTKPAAVYYEAAGFYNTLIFREQQALIVLD